MSRTIIRPLQPADVLLVDLQRHQALEPGGVDLDYGYRVANGGWAWTAERAGKVIGCAGLLEVWPTTALAWALFADNIGPAMVAMTRQARRTLRQHRWPRVEALVACSFPAGLEWACLIGMRQSAVIRRWGPNGQDHVLFEYLAGDQV